MMRVRLLRCALPLLVLMGCGGPSAGPDFVPLTGAPSSVADYGGRWIFINYWADWCKPCLEEIPELNHFHARHTGSRAEVFGVNYDAPGPEKLRGLAAKLDIRFPVLLQAPVQLLEGAHPQVMPTTYVIGPDGKLRGTLLGPQSAGALEQVLAAGAAEG